MEKISSRIPKAILSFIPVVLCNVLWRLDFEYHCSTFLWYKIAVCAAPLVCLLLPCFVKYTKGETYFIIAILVLWLIFGVSHYIL